MDGDQEMAPAEVAAGAASAEVGAGADQEMAPAEVAAGAASAEVGAGADPANDQDPEADGGLNDGLAPTDRIGHIFLLLIGAKAACVDAAEMTLTERGRTMWRETPFQSFNATIFFFKAEKEQAEQHNQQLEQSMLHPWLEYSQRHREKQRKVNRHTKQHVAVTS